MRNINNEVHNQTHIVRHYAKLIMEFGDAWDERDVIPPTILDIKLQKVCSGSFAATVSDHISSVLPFSRTHFLGSIYQHKGRYRLEDPM